MIPASAVVFAVVTLPGDSKRGLTVSGVLLVVAASRPDSGQDTTPPLIAESAVDELHSCRFTRPCNSEPDLGSADTSGVGRSEQTGEVSTSPASVLVLTRVTFRVTSTLGRTARPQPAGHRRIELELS